MSSLSLHKETLTELSADQMAAVVGGYEIRSCLAASCITNHIEIRTTQLCD